MAEETPFAFDWDSIQRITNVVHAVEEQTSRDGVLKPPPKGAVQKFQAWCKVLATTGTAGIYTGLRLHAAVDGTWTYDEAIYIKDVNAQSLTINNIYKGEFLFMADDGSGAAKPVYGVTAGAGAAVSQVVVTGVSCSGSSLTVTTKTLTIPGGTVT